MRLSRPAITLYVGLVFASGAVLGFFANRLYMASTVNAITSKSGRFPNPEEVRKRNLEEARQRAHLSDDQIQKYELILDESKARVKELQEKERPELQAIYQDQVNRINAILTPEQRILMDELRKERIEKQKKRGGRPGGPGPGF